MPRSILSAVLILLLLAAAPTGNTPVYTGDTRLPAPDPQFQRMIEEVVQELGFSGLLHEKRLALSVVDLSEQGEPRYAGLNDREMMYAASLPKIAILLAGFEKIRAGLLKYTPRLKDMFTRLARFSSNEAASGAVREIGFDYIANVLTSSRYRLYDPAENGGLWLGKAYGGPNDYWKRDPLHHLSHGASAWQVARFFYMLDQGRLVNPAYSAEMKEILSHPGIQHKFVKGLASRPGRQIYRKSGTWRNWHCDAALIEAGSKKYVAVALMEDSRGGTALPELIRKIDDLICDRELPALHAHARLIPRPGLN